MTRTFQNARFAFPSGLLSYTKAMVTIREEYWRSSWIVGRRLWQNHHHLAPKPGEKKMNKLQCELASAVFAIAALWGGSAIHAHDVHKELFPPAFCSSPNT